MRGINVGGGVHRMPEFSGPKHGQIGPYRIVSRLGSGGMGEVFRARDTRLGRDIAIKVLRETVASDPERMARFQREARLAASLNHPNIAAIYGFEEVGDSHFLVMELVEGRSLADRLTAGGLPIDEALGIVEQIAGGLEAAHDSGIVHRDLKPSNVVLTPDGKAKILDFGVAKALNEETAARSLEHSPTLSANFTSPGMMVGTVPYISPEQARLRRRDGDGRPRENPGAGAELGPVFPPTDLRRGRPAGIPPRITWNSAICSLASRLR